MHIPAIKLFCIQMKRAYLKQLVFWTLYTLDSDRFVKSTPHINKINKQI
jgi:hypothetical protein